MPEELSLAHACAVAVLLVLLSSVIRRFLFPFSSASQPRMKRGRAAAAPPTKASPPSSPPTTTGTLHPSAHTDGEEGTATLIQLSREAMARGDGERALSLAILAAQLDAKGNDAAVKDMLDAAKSKASKARQAAMDEYACDEEHASELAAAAAVRNDLLLRAGDDSLLGERGEAHVAAVRVAFDSGQSVVCVRCGDLVPRARWEPHRDLWCRKLLDNGGGEEGDEDGEDDDSGAGNYGGFSHNEMDELACQGIKPWDECAGAALDFL